VLGLAVVLVLAAACGTPRAYVADPGPYDRVPPAWEEVLAAARLASERGDAHGAYARVAPLTLEREAVLPVRIFVQELELALLAGEGRVGTLAANSPEEARAVLAHFYEEQAEARPRAEGYVLAARLCSDGEQALALLDEADTLDPSCVWVHYGRAWWRYELRRFKEARAALRTALRLDGGHLPSVRLQATLLAGAGESEAAADALEVWLERTADDPLFSGAERADALLDLAALRVLLDEPGAALELLEDLDPRAVRDPVRAELVRASAHEARGELTQALEAVRRASAQRPDELLALAQRAMLLESAGDAEGERATWRELLSVISNSEAVQVEQDLARIDFSTALFRLQAHTRLARLAAAEASRP
jgi:tetratricopeptide (TPR) repeat protein